MASINYNVRNNSGEIQSGEVALLIGDNGSGKTTLCRAVTLAACGQIKGWMPRASQINQYALGQNPSVSLVDEDSGEITTLNLSSMRWEGTPPDMAFANLLGSDRLGSGVPATEFQRNLSQVLTGQFEEPAIATAFATAGVPAQTAQDLARQICQNPETAEVQWGAVEKSAKNQGIRLKADFERISGNRYGSKIAETWRPEGWAESTAHLNVAESEAEVARLRAESHERNSATARHEGKIQGATTALDQAKASLAHVQEQAERAANRDTSGLDEKRTRVSELESALDAKRNALESAQAQASGIHIEDDAPPPALNCPACSAGITVSRSGSGYALTLAQVESAEDIAARQQARAESEAQLESINADITRLRGEITQTEAEIQGLSREINRLSAPAPDVAAAKAVVAAAQNNLDDLLRSPPDENTNSTEIDERANELEGQIRALSAYRKVQSIRAELAVQEAIQRVAGVSGARSGFLGNALTNINNWLEIFYETVDPNGVSCPRVSLGVTPKGMEIAVVDNGMRMGYPAQLSDGQHQFCSALLKIAVVCNSTISENPPTVVAIDSIDSIDNKGVMALLKGLSLAYDWGALPLPKAVILSCKSPRLGEWVQDSGLTRVSVKRLS